MEMLSDKMQPAKACEYSAGTVIGKLSNKHIIRLEQFSGAKKNRLRKEVT